MVVAAIANRTIEKATEAYTDAGIDASAVEEVKTAEELDAVYKAGYGHVPSPLPLRCHMIIVSQTYNAGACVRPVVFAAAAV